MESTGAIRKAEGGNSCRGNRSKAVGRILPYILTMVARRSEKLTADCQAWAEDIAGE